MKKNTISALYNYFVNADDTIDLSTVVEDIRNEYERFADKASEKTALYDAAEKVLLDALTDTPHISALTPNIKTRKGLFICKENVNFMVRTL